jgi:hypothetical protein
MDKVIILKNHKHIGAHHDLVIGDKRFLLHNGKIVIATIEHFDAFSATVKLGCGFKFKTPFNLIYKQKPTTHPTECTHFLQEEVTS